MRGTPNDEDSKWRRKVARAIVLLIIVSTLIVCWKTGFFADVAVPLLRPLMHDSRFLTLGACLCYIVALVANHGTNVIIPHYSKLRSAIFAFRCRIETRQLPESAESLQGDLLQKIDELIGRLEKRKPHSPGSRSLWIPWLTLTDVQYGWHDLHTLERQAIDLEPPENLPLIAETVAVQTTGATEGSDQPVDPVLRWAISEAQAQLDLRGELAIADDFDRQRVAVLLTSMGLAGIVLIVCALGHPLILLLGAMGGYLAPVVSALTGRKRASWGLLVLSPVAGALTAVGGLFLVRVLSDSHLNVLGSVFYDSANFYTGFSNSAQESPFTLALALLFGFSGRLFSRLALSASSQLDPATHVGTVERPEADSS